MSYETLEVAITALEATNDRLATAVERTEQEATEAIRVSNLSAGLAAASETVATTKAGIAVDKALIATTQAGLSEASAVRSAASAASAAAVVSGGLASLTPDAGMIPLSDGEGKLDEEWLRLAHTTGQSKKHFMSQKAITDAISGFVPYLDSYGLTWDSGEDTYERIGSENYTAIQSLMRRCLVLPDGTVDYYLSATDSRYRENGTGANITGAGGYLGNVMVQVPKFYVKYTMSVLLRTQEISLTPKDGFVVHPAFFKAGVEVDFRYYRAYKGTEVDGKLRSISGVNPTNSKSFTAFRTLAKANGSNWHLTDFNLLNAIKTLMTIEIGTLNTQAVLGVGNTSGSDYTRITGLSNSLGNASSKSPNSSFMSYRGIEDFYGTTWETIDGINFRDLEVFTNSNHTTFDSDVFTGDYTSLDMFLPVASSSYIKDLHFSEDGILPTSVEGASSSTFVTDTMWSSEEGNRVYYHGGSALHGLFAGGFTLNADRNSSSAHATYGAGVSQ